MSNQHPYALESFYIVTKHQKEEAFKKASSFKESKIIAYSADTDSLGTFSPELARKYDVQETLRKKASLLDKTNARLVIASEGTFGPHPQIPFLNSDHEMLIFQDRELGIELFVEEISTKTNVSETILAPESDYENFLNSIQFPTHAVIVFTKSLSLLKKGIQSKNELSRILEQCWTKGEEAILQTDMRAHMNPTRMNVIEQVAKKLFLRISQLCPSCKTPGFGPVEYVTGLECEFCQNETHLTKEIILGCLRCNQKIVNKREDGKEFAPAEFCDLCNP